MNPIHYKVRTEALPTLALFQACVWSPLVEHAEKSYDTLGATVAAMDVPAGARPLALWAVRGAFTELSAAIEVGGGQVSRLAAYMLTNLAKFEVADRRVWTYEYAVHGDELPELGEPMFGVLGPDGLPVIYVVESPTLPWLVPVEGVGAYVSFVSPGKAQRKRICRAHIGHEDL